MLWWNTVIFLLAAVSSVWSDEDKGEDFLKLSVAHGYILQLSLQLQSCCLLLGVQWGGGLGSGVGAGGNKFAEA